MLSLLLSIGSGESGKSTIVKQMKIIHQNGYSADELMLYRLTVLKNLLDSAQALVLALRKFQLEPEIPDNRVSFVCGLLNLLHNLQGCALHLCHPPPLFFH